MFHIRAKAFYEVAISFYRGLNRNLMHENVLFNFYTFIFF